MPQRRTAQPPAYLPLNTSDKKNPAMSDPLGFSPRRSPSTFQVPPARGGTCGGLPGACSWSLSGERRPPASSVSCLFLTFCEHRRGQCCSVALLSRRLGRKLISIMKATPEAQGNQRKANPLPASEHPRAPPGTRRGGPLNSVKENFVRSGMRHE